MMTQTVEIEMDITDFAEDGRLTGEPDGKVYRIRDAARYQESLGRPLTDAEFESFRVC